MAYNKQNFNAGDILKASQLNAMDEQIAANEVALEGKQATLVSAVNIKTINGQSILGEGDIKLDSDSDSDIDTETTTIDAKEVKTGYYYDKNAALIKNTYSASIDMATYDVSKFNRIHVYAKTASLIASYWADVDGNLTLAFAGENANNYIVDDDYDIPEGTVYLYNSYMTTPVPVVTNKSYIEGDITVDKVYNPESENAQSGIAVAQAIASAFPSVDVKLEAEYVQNQAFINSSLVDDTTTNGHAVCQIIRYPVQSGTTIRVVCTTASLCYSCWVNNEGIRTKVFGGTMNSYEINNEYVVPNDAVYFDLSCRNDSTTPSVTSKSSDINAIIASLQKQLKGQFLGKKIGIIGDSIAVGERLNSGDKNFITVFAESVGASGVKNVAIGGWDYCDKDSHGIYRQVASLDGDEDLIIIFAGTNDYGHHSPLGEAWTLEPNDEGNNVKKATTNTYSTTFCGGVHKAIETVWEKYDYIPIVICTPLHRNYASASSGYPDTSHWDNSEKLFIDDYIRALKKVASFYGIPVFDSYRLTGLYPINSQQNTSYFADGIHPNSAGHKIIGESLASFIKSLYLPLKQ